MFWHRVIILRSLKYMDQAHYSSRENTFYICNTKTHEYKTFLQSERELFSGERHTHAREFSLWLLRRRRNALPAVCLRGCCGVHQPLLPSTSWLPWNTWLCQEPVLLCFPCFLIVTLKTRTGKGLCIFV